jgi:hypothetical protein
MPVTKSVQDMKQAFETVLDQGAKQLFFALEMHIRSAHSTTEVGSEPPHGKALIAVPNESLAGSIEDDVAAEASGSSALVVRVVNVVHIRYKHRHCF